MTFVAGLCGPIGEVGLTFLTGAAPQMTPFPTGAVSVPRSRLRLAKRGYLEAEERDACPYAWDDAVAELFRQGVVALQGGVHQVQLGADKADHAERASHAG